MADFLPAMPHGSLREAFPDVFVVRGTFRMGPALTIPRNMTIVRQGDELTIINSVRLTQDGERELEKLGKPKHLLRIGNAHGADDPYYRHRYRLKMWAPPKMRHANGAKTDEELRDGATPIAKSRAFCFERGRAPEAAIVLDGGVLVTCDSYQNWETYEGSSLLGKATLFAMGFGPTIIGGPWTRRMGAAVREDFERLKSEPFRHLIPGHGDVLHDRAREGLDIAIAGRFGS